MSDDELMEAISGLFAYDTGCTDSGIRDELLRHRVIEEIHKDTGKHEIYSKRLSRIARELFMTDECIDAGYGLESVTMFTNWLEDYMSRSER